MPLFNFPFTVLDTVDSTNNYAMAKVHAGLAKHGDAFFTHAQTNGKGQRGKHWNTGVKKNILLSIVTAPDSLHLSDQFHLSVAVALACRDFFECYAGDETKIKWPNDIYWRDRKAGGILIENVIGKIATNTTMPAPNKWKYAVVGIGININQTVFDATVKNAVSLKQITAGEYNPEALARELHAMVLDKIAALAPGSFKKMLSEYNDCLYKKDELVTLKKQSILFETKVNEVTAKGQLFTTDRIDNYFEFGEVEWML